MSSIDAAELCAGRVGAGAENPRLKPLRTTGAGISCTSAESVATDVDPNRAAIRFCAATTSSSSSSSLSSSIEVASASASASAASFAFSAST